MCENRYDNAALEKNSPHCGQSTFTQHSRWKMTGFCLGDNWKKKAIEWILFQSWAYVECQNSREGVKSTLK